MAWIIVGGGPAVACLGAPGVKSRPRDLILTNPYRTEISLSGEVLAAYRRKAEEIEEAALVAASARKERV